MRKTVLTGTIVLCLCLFMIGKPVKIGREQLLATDPGWQDNYDNFQPDPWVIEKIREKADHGLKVEVYLGIWCIDSKNNVPRFMKIMDLVKGLNPTITYFDVKRSDKKGTPYFVEELKIERVPTFIFYHHNKEIGRIVENPLKSLGEDILAIITG